MNDHSTGEERKLAAHSLLKARRECLIRAAQRALLNHLLMHGNGTADDVRDVIVIPGDVNPVCLGAAPGELARGGIIRAAGFVKSKRPMAHARPLQVWELASESAANQWLACHPDLPEPESDELQGTLFATEGGD